MTTTCVCKGLSIASRSSAQCRRTQRFLCVKHNFMPSMCERTAGLWEQPAASTSHSRLRPQSAGASALCPGKGRAMTGRRSVRQRPQTAKPAHKSVRPPAQQAQERICSADAGGLQQRVSAEEAQRAAAGDAVATAGSLRGSQRHSKRRGAQRCVQSSGKSRKRASVTTTALDKVGALAVAPFTVSRQLLAQFQAVPCTTQHGRDMPCVQRDQDLPSVRRSSR